MEEEEADEEPGLEPDSGSDFPEMMEEEEPSESQKKSEESEVDDAEIEHDVFEE